MYDMSGFHYDIRDVVRILNLRIRHKNSASYDADCPFCGDTKGKLNINISKNVFRCNRCDTSGGMLDLYAKLYGVSKSEANRQIREALNLGEYRDDYKVEPKKEEPPAVENSPLAGIEEIDRTYSRMLSMLTLSKKHQEDLLKRGLTMEQITAQRYRSVPLFGLKSMAKTLVEQGYTVKGVPGFYLDEDENWTINFKKQFSGILIPYLNLRGQIQGFQIRLDRVTDSMKYIWLSSVNCNQGVSSGSPVHIIGDLDAETVYITEGALKGTVAHYLSGDTFVCAAGVNQYRNLKPVLEGLKLRNLKQVFEAYDMDKKMRTLCDMDYSKCAGCAYIDRVAECPYKVEKRKIIQNGCRRVYEICGELQLTAQRMLWDVDEYGEWKGEIKGIDDYYYETVCKKEITEQTG